MQNQSELRFDFNFDCRSDMEDFQFTIYSRTRFLLLRYTNLIGTLFVFLVFGIVLTRSFCWVCLIARRSTPPCVEMMIARNKSRDTNTKKNRTTERKMKKIIENSETQNCCDSSESVCMWLCEYLFSFWAIRVLYLDLSATTISWYKICNTLCQTYTEWNGFVFFDGYNFSLSLSPSIICQNVHSNA